MISEQDMVQTTAMAFVQTTATTGCSNVHWAQLAAAFQLIFNFFLRLSKVLKLWSLALSWCSRRNSPGLCDHKPAWLTVILASQVKKIFEILVLQLMVRDSLDPVCILGSHWCWCHNQPMQNLHTPHVTLWESCSLTSSASSIPYIHSSWPWSCQWYKWIYVWLQTMSPMLSPFLFTVATSWMTIQRVGWVHTHVRTLTHTCNPWEVVVGGGNL